MELFLWRRDEYERLYNCSFYDVDQIPIEKRTHTRIGLALIALATVYEVLYIPCIIAFWRRLAHNNAYRFMFFIGVVDLICMLVNGFITGYSAIQGFMFCSHPYFIYVAGAWGYSMWIAESSAAILLAFNRCVEMSSPTLNDILYRGYRAWLWICLPSLYALYCFLYVPPAMFNGVVVSWFFNPHIGYYDDVDGTYNCRQHSIHNVMVVVLLVGTYIIFTIMLVAQSTKLATFARNDSYHIASQAITIAQVLLISIVNGVTSGVYVYMQFFKISDSIILLGTFMWLSSHGMPSVIYLTLNRTIRNDCRRLLRHVVGGQSKISTVCPSSMTCPPLVGLHTKNPRNLKP